jgi:TonB family protein
MTAGQLKQMIGQGVRLVLVLTCVNGFLNAQDQRQITTYDLIREAAGLQKTDIAKLREQARAGDARAQVLLGMAYEHGFGTKQDSSIAANWFLKAAQAGEPLGEIMLGRFYQHGIAMARNADEAVVWFRRAADTGNAEAQFELGYAYERGSGVPADQTQADALYRMAADSGFAPAKCALAANDPKYQRIGEGTTMPRVIEAPDPEYSEEARKAKFGGTTVLWVGIGEDGTVQDVCVIRPLGLDLESKAIEAVRRWRFQPGTRDGRPVPFAMHVENTFRLY